MIVLVKIPGTTFKEAENAILHAALEHAKWDRDEAAKLLDIPKERLQHIRVPDGHTVKARNEQARNHLRKGAWLALMPTEEDQSE